MGDGVAVGVEVVGVAELSVAVGPVGMDVAEGAGVVVAVVGVIVDPVGDGVGVRHAPSCTSRARYAGNSPRWMVTVRGPPGNSSQMVSGGLASAPGLSPLGWLCPDDPGGVLP